MCCPSEQMGRQKKPPDSRALFLHERRRGGNNHPNQKKRISSEKIKILYSFQHLDDNKRISLSGTTHSFISLMTVLKESL